MDAVAVAEASVADQNNDNGSNRDGNDSMNGETNNRFQKAIAAWRSKSSTVALPCLSNMSRHRPGVPDLPARHHCC